MARPIQLSSGRIVLHRPINGGEEAYFEDGSDMTDDEWSEYSRIVMAGSAKRNRDKISERKRKSLEAFIKRNQ